MSKVPFKEYLEQVVDGYNLTQENALRAFFIMMSGGATPAQMAAFLVALRIKGETVAELTGAARAMRHKALAFEAPEGAIDTCGTGGDASGTYNISTATAIVTAACGVPVVKHGNRSVSSKSGSADVMRELGVDLAASAEVMQKALEQCGLCFLMAPAYHKAMRHVAPVRQELGLRTAFNLLGPLSNPAGVKRQLLGVYSAELLMPLAETLLELGSEKAWIVHGAGGLDEISLTGETQIAVIENGAIKRKEISPQEAGLAPCNMEDLKGGDAIENAEALERLLAGRESAYRDIVCFNAAAALMIAEKTTNLREGVKMAAEAIDNGSARQTLNVLVKVTNEKDASDEQN